LNKGAKARLIIPPDLAYGNRPIGKIPPNSTLIFDVEVVDIK
jgi:FKBP-type peptidyl-prolyl cis-trans isomerase FkpA